MRDALVGGALAGVGFTGLKLFAGQLLQSVSHNRFLAASSILLGLLVWMNLVARLTLVAAALSATLAADRGLLPASEPAGRAAPVDTAGSAPEGAPARPADAAASRRAARLLLAAGFVLGVAGARLARRAVPERRQGDRGHD